MRIITVIATILAVAGCASPNSRVMVGEARPAIQPAEVRIYTATNPPEHYEEVALLSTRDAGGWVPTEQNRTERVIHKLKNMAAQVGANGILLNDFDRRKESEHTTLIGYPTISTTSQITTGEATAIWVSDQSAPDQSTPDDDTLSKSDVVQACIDECREEKNLSAAACFDECAGT